MWRLASPTQNVKLCEHFSNLFPYVQNRTFSFTTQLQDMNIKGKSYKKQKIFSEKQKGFRDGLSYSTPQEGKKQGEMPLPSLGPIPLKKCRI